MLSITIALPTKESVFTMEDEDWHFNVFLNVPAANLGVVGSLGSYRDLREKSVESGASNKMRVGRIWMKITQ